VWENGQKEVMPKKLATAKIELVTFWLHNQAESLPLHHKGYTTKMFVPARASPGLPYLGLLIPTPRAGKLP
jgi:hypothetical protein